MATKQYPRFNEFYLCNQPVFKMMFDLGLKIKPDGILIGCLSYRTRTLRPAKPDSSVKQQDDDEDLEVLVLWPAVVDLRGHTSVM
jgi:hypothetical protein